MAPLVKIPFMSSNERFDRLSTTGIPGPGAYNPKAKIQTVDVKSDVLKNKNFGTNAERFSMNEEDQVIFYIFFL